MPDHIYDICLRTLAYTCGASLLIMGVVLLGDTIPLPGAFLLGIFSTISGVWLLAYALGEK